MFDLVPVDHDPFNPTLIPVNHDPFASSDALTQPNIRVAQNDDLGINKSPVLQVNPLASTPMMQHGGASLPYESAPQTLMGFPKNGFAKSFEELNYKYSQPVRVTYPASDNVPEQSFVDAVSGLNQSHALARARINWDGAKIEPISAEDAIKEEPSLAPLTAGYMTK